MGRDGLVHGRTTWQLCCNSPEHTNRLDSSLPNSLSPLSLSLPCFETRSWVGRLMASDLPFSQSSASLPPWPAPPCTGNSFHALAHSRDLESLWLLSPQHLATHPLDPSLARHLHLCTFPRPCLTRVHWPCVLFCVFGTPRPHEPLLLFALTPGYPRALGLAQGVSSPFPSVFVRHTLSFPCPSVVPAHPQGT